MQDLFQIDDAYEELKNGLYTSKCIKKNGIFLDVKMPYRDG